MRSPRLSVLGLRAADSLAAALGGRPRPLVVGVFASAAAADVRLLPAGVLPTRISTRSAVSRSVNRAATVARSVSRRASRSLTCIFSAPIWSNIVDVALRIVAFSVQVDRNDQSCWHLTVKREMFNHSLRRLTTLAGQCDLAAVTIILSASNTLILLDILASESCGGYSQCPVRINHPSDDVRDMPASQFIAAESVDG